MDRYCACLECELVSYTTILLEEAGVVAGSYDGPTCISS